MNKLNQKMLKQRLITAFILIPIIVWGILSLSSSTLAWVFSTFVVLGAWEWAGLCGWHTFLARSIYAIVNGIMLLIVYWLWHQPSMMHILLAACLWWLLALYWVLRYQQGHDLMLTSKLLKAILGFFILLPTWVALVILHQHNGGQWVLFLLILIWAADSGAYFIGKRWGQTKLADKISPGKTQEGVAGALLMGLVVSVSYAIFKALPLTTSILFMLLCLLTVMVSILGDLLESLFKRQVGIKDSGQLLPGHGGILDRIDSLTSAAPIFVIGLIPLLD
ncbi:MAG TPA: phosphatidate cytidylyltransferase [Thioploca sp.]|nr:MAG: phosphatidate cytidylyltransferase [Gammaproteobacteria bacterium]HDN26112.1 phosphatidate cytidylyltransferase [Thioploca sp.]